MRPNRPHDQRKARLIVNKGIHTKVEGKRHTALLTEEDCNFVADFFDHSDRENNHAHLRDDQEEIADYQAQYENEGDLHLAYVSESDLHDVESSLEQSAFSNDRKISNWKQTMIKSLYTHL